VAPARAIIGPVSGSRRSQRRNSRVALAAIAGLALVALALAAIATGRRGVASYPADSPEATVQRYLDAVSDGRGADAAAELTDELADACRSRLTTYYFQPEFTRAVLTEVERRDDQAVVRVDITESYGGGPFGPDENTVRTTFVLTPRRAPTAPTNSSGADGAAGWAISEVPWPLYDCPGLVGA